MHGRERAAHRAAQGSGVLGMFFVEDQHVLRAQQLRQHLRRSGIELRLRSGVHRLHGGAIGVQQRIGIGKGPHDALRRFAGALRLLAAEIIDPASRMGIDQGQRALFLLQGPDQRDQQAVLHDVGAVAGMEGMAIIHGDPIPCRHGFIGEAGR